MCSRHNIDSIFVVLLSLCRRQILGILCINSVHSVRCGKLFCCGGGHNIKYLRRLRGRKFLSFNGSHNLEYLHHLRRRNTLRFKFYHMRVDLSLRNLCPCFAVSLLPGWSLLGGVDDIDCLHCVHGGDTHSVLSI